MGLCTIKTSSDFRRVRGGARYASANFVIETRERPAAQAEAEVTATRPTPPCNGARFGFTVTRKLGNAVVRNRIRRRLKEAIRTIDPAIVVQGSDYVVVPRAPVLDMAFGALKKEVEDALIRLHRKSPGSGRERTGKAAPVRSR